MQGRKIFMGLVAALSLLLLIIYVNGSANAFTDAHDITLKDRHARVSGRIQRIWNDDELLRRNA